MSRAGVSGADVLDFHFYQLLAFPKPKRDEEMSNRRGAMQVLV